MTTGLELQSIMHELDTAEKICFAKHRDAIVADVEPKFVLPHIEAAGIFSKEEREDILRQDSVENRVRRLLDVLCGKGETGYNVFINALEYDNAYSWIAQKLRMEHSAIKEENVYVHKVLQNGAVPFRLVHLVKRRKIVENIRGALRSLCSSEHRCNGAVVVHGMIGCGKSILAAEALRDYKLLKEFFPDGVHWLPIGKLREPNDVLHKMHLQLDRLIFDSHKDVNTVEMATCRLKRWSLNVKALLVLDDVWSPRVVEAFSVGCPLLVTTRDDSVVNDMRMYKHSIQVNEGLTLDETRQLFASVLKMPERELPPEVDEIWSTHRGLPLLMANIAAVLVPNARRPDKWRPYIEDSRGKGRVRHGSGSTYDAALELIISSLDSEQLGYFQSFALFLEDVDIPSVVFEVLWDMDAVSVEHAMAGLVQKSLVRMEPVHNSYTYGIHDLYLNFLKRKATSLKDLHRQFVEKVLKRWEPWTMPCGRGYFYWYLGYHLDEAGMDQKFRDIFLDLRFVNRKVQCNCPSDLVTDLHRYEHHFRCDPQVAKERLDLLRFLQPNAHLLSDRDTDVIQLALSQPRSSSVHQKALVIARKRAAEGDHQTPYFMWTNMPDHWSQAEVRMKAPCGGVNHAEFSPDDTIIASAGDDGVVRLWQSHSGNELEALTGHTEAVNFCTFSPDGHVLASASSDQQVFLWNVGECAHKTPASPLSASKTGRLSGRRSSRCCRTASVAHSAPVLCCAFSPDGKLLASGDSLGFVKIHHVMKAELGEELAKAIPRQESAVRSCSFTSDSRRLVLALDAQYVVIWKVPSVTQTVQAEQPERPQVLDHVDSAVVDCCLSHTHRGAFGARQQIISAAGQHIWSWDLRSPSPDAKRYNGFWMSYNLTCCAVSPDRTLIAAGTSLRAILLWNADTGAALGSFKGDAEDVKSVRFSHNGSQLVSSSSDGTVVVWDVDNYRRCSRLALMPVLAVAFEGQSPLVATFDESGVIQISSGLEAKEEFRHALSATKNKCCEEVSCCCFSHDRKAVIFGTRNGHVNLFSLDTREWKALGNHNGSITSLIAWPEGLAISSSLDGTLKVWHRDGSHRTLIGHRGQITAPCRLFGGNSKLLSSSDKGELLIWNLKDCSQSPCVQIEAHRGSPVLCCDVSSDGQWLLSGSTDMTIQLWKAETGDLLSTQTLDECVRCCRFGPDPRSVVAAAGTDEGSVYVYLLEEDLLQKVGQHKHKLWVYDLAFSPDGHQLASLSESICWWSLDSLEFASALSSLDDGSIASFESLAQSRCHRQLQRFQLQSSKAVALFASPNFETFVTVDDSGILYVLNRLAAAQASER